MAVYVEKHGVPRCVTLEQYEVWRRAARAAWPSKESGFCEDCTPEYQRRMIRERRCSRPTIRFFIEPAHVVPLGGNRGCLIEETLYGAPEPGTTLDTTTGQRVPHQEVFA